MLSDESASRRSFTLGSRYFEPELVIPLIVTAACTVGRTI